jgi:transposase
VRCGWWLITSSRIGCTSQTLNEWVKKAERDSAQAGLDERYGNQAQGPRAGEPGLRQANEILRKASAYFA